MVLVILAFIVPIADAQWSRIKFWSQDKKYNLGSDPTIGAFHKLNKDLGWFIVDGFDRDYSIMTVAFKSGGNTSNPGLEPDHDVKVLKACEMPMRLKWDEVCALKTKDKDKENEYHMQISWWYEDKKDVRVVVVEVKMKRFKLQ
jgi:hypothetical protein